MKRIALFAGLVLIAVVSSGQKAVDALFDKYGNRDGFVTVTISGDILKFAASMDEDDDLDFLPEKITNIRILAQDDDAGDVENFNSLLSRELDLDAYEEFMSIKESDQTLKILVRTEGTRIREFLMLAGGKDNALIQINGDITRAEAKRISEHAKKHRSLSLISERR
ncbi:MAG: DUF4252 domain-containing protein [Bacteroidales bacterium]|jgi:hypothetical protein|nr:DUF4252 domain-containing protein [Bacteroidales bacterium]